MSGFVLSEYRRLVVKVGSSLLIGDDGHVHRGWLEGLAADIASLQGNGHEVLIVSSGAIAIGSTVLGINKRRARLENLQAAAAAGQVQLVHAYQEALGPHGVAAAQVLLTPEDTENRRRFLNARGTLGKLLDHEVVPIINENDTVATEEIRYGDNDRLAARVAQLVMADALILLSDVDGLYTADLGKDAGAELIPGQNHRGSAGYCWRDPLRCRQRRYGNQGSGRAHCDARRMLDRRRERRDRASPRSARCGRQMHRVPGRGNARGGAQTVLAGVLEVRGELRLDDGAVNALHDGKSLLPVGVVEVVGNFRRGDVVTLVDAAGNELGRGLAEYSDREAERLAGCQSEQVEEQLGYRGRSVMVHRDELVLFGNEH